jgi:hypothetical protein
VSDDAGAGRTTLSLVTLDGSQVAHVTLPQSTVPWPEVGGGMLTYVDQNVLKGLTPSGSVETLGPVAGYNGGPAIVSPDGQHWMWGSYAFSNGSVTSKLMLGTRGSPDRVIAQETSQQRHLEPYRWTSAGPVYQDAALGIGGYILFSNVTGPNWRFDVDSGRITTVLGGTSCILGDVARDGTIACFGNSSSTLDVLSTNGHIVELTLPKPAFNFHGAVSFAPGSGARTLVIGGGTGAGANGVPEQYVTELVDAFSRTMRPFGPTGLRPADGPPAWLPDGSLLAYRPARAAGGDPGVYVVAPDGSAKKVLSSGTALGVISG